MSNHNVFTCNVIMCERRPMSYVEIYHRPSGNNIKDNFCWKHYRKMLNRYIESDVFGVISHRVVL